MKKILCLLMCVSSTAMAAQSIVPPPHFTPESMPSTTNQIQQSDQYEELQTMQRQTQQNQELANQQALATPFPIVGLQQGVTQTQQALSVAEQQSMSGQILPPSELNGLQSATQMEQSEAALPIPPVEK